MNGHMPAQLDLVLRGDIDLDQATRQVLGYALARGMDASNRARVGSALHLAAAALLPADALRISALVTTSTASIELTTPLGVDDVPSAIPQSRKAHPDLDRARALAEWLEVERDLEGCRVTLHFEIHPAHFSDEDPVEYAEYLNAAQVRDLLEAAASGGLTAVSLPHAVAGAVGRLLTQTSTTSIRLSAAEDVR